MPLRLPHACPACSLTLCCWTSAPRWWSPCRWCPCCAPRPGTAGRQAAAGVPPLVCAVLNPTQSLIGLRLLRTPCRFLIAAGDPLQLPPVVASPAHVTAGPGQVPPQQRPHGLLRPLFVRLAELGLPPFLLRRQYRCARRCPAYATGACATQQRRRCLPPALRPDPLPPHWLPPGRCHPDISAVPNAQFYGGRLLDGCTREQRASLLPGLPSLAFLDVRGQEQYGAGGLTLAVSALDVGAPLLACLAPDQPISAAQPCLPACPPAGRSASNQAEAEAVAAAVEALVAAGVAPGRCGVITFFRAQVMRGGGWPGLGLMLPSRGVPPAYPSATPPPTGRAGPQPAETPPPTAGAAAPAAPRGGGRGV